MKKFLICLAIFMASFMFVKPVFAGQGCCSHHGGQSYCSGSHWICSDGWRSSCFCSSYDDNDYDYDYDDYDYDYEEDDEGSNFIGYLIFFGIIVGVYAIYRHVKLNPNLPVENSSTKNKESQDTDDNTYGNEWLVVILVIIFLMFIITLAVSTSEDSYYDDTGYNYIEQIDEWKYNNILSKKEDVIIVVGQLNCSYTDQYEEKVLSKIINDYSITVYRLDIDEVSEEKQTELNISGTPTTLFIVDGKIIDRIDGYVDYGTLLEKLKKLQFISEN